MLNSKNNISISVYVDMGEDCIDLTFQLGSTTLDPTWNVRVTQYEMNYGKMHSDHAKYCHPKFLL